MGQVWATITTDWKQSKDKNSKYCGMSIDGVEYWYTAENENVEQALAGFSGRTILIQASGSREAAQIEVLQEQEGGAAPRTAPAAAAPRPAASVARPAPGRAPAPAPAAQRAPVAHSAPAAAPVAPAPVAKTPEQAIAEARDFLERNRLLLELCSYEAGKMLMQYNTVIHKAAIEASAIPAAGPEQMQSWTSCLFIEANKAGIGRSLPTDQENDQPPV